MALYLTLTVLVVILGLFVQNNEYVSNSGTPKVVGGARNADRQRAFNACMAVFIFLLLAGVSASRIAVGNDYWVYRFQFNLIMQERHVSYEIGFNAVVWLLQYLFGYDNYLPVFGFFSIITCVFFVKAMYDQGEWFGATVFLLMANGYYFSSLNSVRYFLVLAMALYSCKYVIRRQYAAFIVCILIASLFHKTVLLVIPVYLMASWASRIPWKKWYSVILAGMAVLIVAGEPLWRKIIFLIYPFYEGSSFDVRNLSLANIGKCMGTLILYAICLYMNRNNGSEGEGDGNVAFGQGSANRFYLFLNVFGLMVYTCGSFIPEVSRVGYYMIITQIFLIPSILANMKKGWFRNLCIVGCTLVFCIYFAMFLKDAYATNIRLLPYRSWWFD